VAEGAQGPRSYQFAAQRVWEHREGVPGRACWLVLRRNLDGSELKYYFSNAPADTPLLTLAQVGAMRWVIETEFQTYKGEAGLDEYEARSWQSWVSSHYHGHAGRGLPAHARAGLGGKAAPDYPAADQSRATAPAAAAEVDA
jgi:hypothetical protein